MNATNFRIPYICIRCSPQFLRIQLHQSRRITRVAAPDIVWNPPDLSTSSNPPKPVATDAKSPTSVDFNSYSDTIPPTPAQLAYADRFFTIQSPSFLFSSSKFLTLPIDSVVPEVAFFGRSNVGKSSLLNALLQRTTNKIAHVSSKPGRTRTMNVFGIGGSGGGVKPRKDKFGQTIEGEKLRWIGPGGVVVVDMPGYGHASREDWGKQIEKYLVQRKQLRRAFVLIDPEHGIKNSDEALLSMLRLNGIPHQIVLSKIDKILLKRPKTLSPKVLQKNLERLHQISNGIQETVQLKHPSSRTLRDILACSAEKSFQPGKKLGIDTLRWAVLQAAGLDSRINIDVNILD